MNDYSPKWIQSLKSMKDATFTANYIVIMCQHCHRALDLMVSHYICQRLYSNWVNNADASKPYRPS